MLEKKIKSSQYQVEVDGPLLMKDKPGTGAVVNM